MTTTLTVADRIATISTDEKIVAGNTYAVTLSLDSEWTGTYYVRVRFGSLYYDIPASGSSVNVQIPVGYPEVGLGIYSENIGICTNEVRIKVLRSILEQGVSVVEFDTDLYTQWQNEVSELVCDSDFDAESDRPVKNSVITAWKNTVPLDSALVHKTGNETVGGVKTFTSDPAITALNYPVLKMDSQQDASATGIKGEIRMMDRKNGSQSAVSLVQAITNTGYNIGRMSVYNPDKSQAYNIEVRSYSDHQLVTVDAPYYPVDGSSNPQALTANALVASGNIAVDPRIVHTTGNETIAGGKTFTATMNVKGTAQLVPRTVYDSGTPSTYYGWKGRISIVDQKDGAESTVGDILCASVQTYGEVSMRAYKPDRSAFSELRLRHYADFQSLLIPSHYPVDGSGNPTAPAEGEAMSSGMVAVDPRIVRTTGNQAIAGAKTFNNAITHVFRRLDGYVGAGQYVKILTLKNNVRAQVEASIEAYKCIGQIVIDTVPKNSTEQRGGWYVVDPSGWLNGKAFEFFLLYNTVTNGIEAWGHSDTAIAFRINGVRSYSGNINPTAANLDLAGVTQTEDPRLDTTTYPDGAFPIVGRIIGGN